ncbi:MAG: acetyl-CoA carboxylase biotin carboxylase subunit [Acidobacteriota bacterium]
MRTPPPFDKILVANRGEIAVRVIRCCREMGVRSVAIFSDVDRKSRHVLEADEAHGLQGDSPRQVYLDAEQIVEIAKEVGAGAIHPGYGFLSENFEFAELCKISNIVFIGPGPEAIRLMGNKVSARELMRQAGVAVTPGSDGPVATAADVKKVADEVGYPILLKAAAGGGGKGMRIVRDAKTISSALRAVRSEAAASFGDDAVFVERYVDRPRHIEVQVLAGADGTTLHLGERECSIQRRHQKLVEESPSPAVDETLRARLGEMATRAAQAVGYRNAGTVEFIMDEQQNVYFMEMNTRLQVEHPVTEMVTGIDLVRAQVLIAAGLDPGFTQDDIRLHGSAIECRIFAEDPDNHFLPSPGRITSYTPASGPGVREDSGVYAGYTVPLDYDPTIGKLIVWGRTRQTALDRMRRALGELHIGGVKTTLPFHRALIDHPAFRAGDIDTHFIDTHSLAPSAAGGPAIEKAALAVALAAAHQAAQRLGRDGRRVDPSRRPMSGWKRAALSDGMRSRLPGAYRP